MDVKKVVEILEKTGFRDPYIKDLHNNCETIECKFRAIVCWSGYELEIKGTAIIRDGKITYMDGKFWTIPQL